MQFFMFLTSEKPVFELMTNLKFSFLKVEPEVFKFSQNQYFYLSFQTFNPLNAMLFWHQQPRAYIYVPI